MGYEPPFSITSVMLKLTAEIAGKLERVTGVGGLEAKPYLRRNNRIRSVYSSLAIEANSLTVDEIRSVLDGKTVIGPLQEIEEVKNAYQAYDMLGKFDPYSLLDLLKMHGVMTGSTVRDAGKFRTRGEGVFSGKECIFMAPPPLMVPDLMQSLFEWINVARRDLHPLILSSVFHYEFVFIHPFSDGNGRMARLWQTALLADWNDIFKYLPIESRIHEFQDDYYGAIAECHKLGSSQIFIEFMLHKINIALDGALEQLVASSSKGYAQKLLNIMEYGVHYSAAQLMQRLNLRSRDNFRNLYLRPALDSGLIAMSIPDKPTSRNQTYIRI